MPWKINFRFVIPLLLVSGLLIGGGLWLHYNQLSRRLTDYRERAYQMVEEANTTPKGDPEKKRRGARILNAYLNRAPDDTKALLYYADLLAEVETSPAGKRNALELYNRVAILEPTWTDYRKRAAELALAAGEAQYAVNHAKALAAANPTDESALLLHGYALEANRKTPEALDVYQAACQLKKSPEPFARRARIGRTSSPPNVGMADFAMKNLRDNAPNSYDKFFTLAAYEHTYRGLEGSKNALEDLKRARDFEPKKAQGWIVSGIVASARANQLDRGKGGSAEATALRADAKGFYREGLKLESTNAAGYVGLAEIAARENNVDEAAKILREGRKAVTQKGPDREAILIALGERLLANPAQAAEVESILVELRDKDPAKTPYKAELLAAKLDIQRSHWLAALNALDAATKKTREPNELYQIAMLRGRCHGALNDPTGQRAAYEAARLLVPDSEAALMGIASAHLAQGNWEEARQTCASIVNLNDNKASYSVMLTLSRLDLYFLLAQPPNVRDFRPLTARLGAMRTQFPQAREPLLLQSEIEFAQGRTDQADKLLADGQKDFPTDQDFWLTRAALAVRRKDLAAANATLAAAQAKFGDGAELRLAKLRLINFDDKARAAGALDQLAQGSDSFPAEGQARLLRSLSGAYRSINRLDSARAMLDRLAKLLPDEVMVRLQLFDVAMAANDEAGQVAALEQIKAVEGSDRSLSSYGEALRIIQKAHQKGDSSQLDSARRLLNEAGAKRPQWARIPIALAQISELRKEQSQEIKHLSEAFDFGERSPAAMRRLVQLYASTSQYDRANEVMKSLMVRPEPLSSDMQRLAAEMSLRSADPGRAVSIADTAVDSASKDPTELIWKARINLGAGQFDKARETAQLAIKYGPERADPWVVVLQAMVGRASAAEVDALLRDAQAKLPPLKGGPIALAQCFEIAGRRPAAIEQFSAAVKAAPNDANTLRAAADYFLRVGAANRAEPLLERLEKGEAGADEVIVVWARRNLALMVGLRPDGSGLERAKILIGKNLSIRETVDDLRTKGLIYGHQFNTRNEAIRAFEKARTMLPPPTVHHEGMLAQLYELAGDWPKARRILLSLVGRDKDGEQFIPRVITAFLEHGEVATAKTWASRLRSENPHHIGTIALCAEVTQRVTNVDDPDFDYGRMQKMVEEFLAAAASVPRDPAEKLRMTAAVMTDLAAAAKPETEIAKFTDGLHRRAVETTKRPEAILAWAEFKAKRNEPAEAIALTQRALDQGVRVEAVAMTASVVLAAPAITPAQVAKIGGWIEQARAKAPGSSEVLFVTAILSERLGQYDRAEQFYRQSLERNPQMLPALNNLALLLALHRTENTNRLEEAVQLIQRAFNLVGPKSALRDTLAVVYWKKSKAQEALTEINAAIASGGNASTYFHKAVILVDMPDTSREAGTAFREAKDKRNLTPAELHPLERDDFDRLARRFSK